MFIAIFSELPDLEQEYQMNYIKANIIKILTNIPKISMMGLHDAVVKETWIYPSSLKVKLDVYGLLHRMIGDKEIKAKISGPETMGSSIVSFEGVGSRFRKSNST